MLLLEDSQISTYRNQTIPVHAEFLLKLSQHVIRVCPEKNVTKLLK